MSSAFRLSFLCIFLFILSCSSSTEKSAAGGACFFYGTAADTEKLGICRQFSGGGAGNRELCMGLAGVYQKVEYFADRNCPKQADYIGECRSLSYANVSYTQYYYNWPATLAKEDAEKVCAMRSGGQFAFDPAMGAP